MLIEKFQSAGKSINRERFRIILENSAALRFQMRDMTASKVCTHATIGDIFPICAIGKI